MNKLFLARYIKENFKKYDKTWDKEEYIKAHRVLWCAISLRICELRSTVDIDEIKMPLIRPMWGSVYLRANCFLCDYTEYNCNVCPLCKHVKEMGCLDGLYDEVYKAITWEEQAKLAYKIAMLPEVR